LNTIPVTIVDDFLENPNSIRNWALSLPFDSDPNNRWPGKRTQELSTINPNLNRYLSNKILSLFYPKIPLDYTITNNFQLKEKFIGSGWIHQDSNPITCILYLSEPKDSENEGTSMFKLKHNRYFPIESPEEGNLMMNYRSKHYKNNALSKEELDLKQEYENNAFEKTLSIPCKFNRLLCFDGTYWHSTNGSTKEINHRLTLVSFIYNLETDTQFPILRHKSVALR